MLSSLSVYLVCCSSGGVPVTSVMSSAVVTSTLTPADPGGPDGDVAAVRQKKRNLSKTCVRKPETRRQVITGHSGPSLYRNKFLAFPHGKNHIRQSYVW